MGLHIGQVGFEQLAARAVTLEAGKNIFRTFGCYVRQREVETARRQFDGDGGADTAAPAGDNSQGFARAHRSTSCRRWFPTRNACAATVSAGFTAADDGKKPASTTYRFSWSQALQSGSSAEVAGSMPKRTVPH